MADKQDEPSGFKVVDRRSFTAEGTRRQDEPAKPPEPSPPPAGKGGTASPIPYAEEELPEDGSDFETLVSYLSTTAMFQLGLIAGPGGERIPPDMVSARRTIDLLGVLQEKTRGNLTEDEARLLDSVLYELRMTFVELEKRQARRA